jgi:hypothetical protein
VLRYKWLGKKVLKFLQKNLEMEKRVVPLQPLLERGAKRERTLIGGNEGEEL